MDNKIHSHIIKTPESPQVSDMQVNRSTQLSNAARLDKQFRYNKDNLVKPSPAIDRLMSLYANNFAHKFCVDTKASCISGSGFTLVSKIGELYDVNDQEMKAEIDIYEKKIKTKESVDEEETTKYNEYKSIYTKHKKDKKRLIDLFNHINPDESFCRLNQDSDIDREAAGFMCWEVVRNGRGEIIEVYHIPAISVRMMNNNLGICQIKYAIPNYIGDANSNTTKSSLQKVFFQKIGLPIIMDRRDGSIRGIKQKNNSKQVILWYDDDGNLSINNSPLPEEFRANEVIIHRKYNPINYWYGLPDIISAVDSCIGDKGASDYQEQFFDNNAVPRMAVIYKGCDLDAETYEAIQHYFSSDIKGNSHCTLLLEVPGDAVDENGGKIIGGEIKFEKLAMDVTEASFRDYRKDNREHVHIAHRVPISLSPAPTQPKSNKDGALVDLEVFKSQVIRPIQSEREFIINKYLIEENFGIDTWEFKFNEIDSIDEYRRMQIYEGYLKESVMTINEVRAALGYSPKKGGDRSFKITPIGMVFLDEVDELTTGELAATPDKPLAGSDQGGSDGGRPIVKKPDNVGDDGSPANNIID